MNKISATLILVVFSITIVYSQQKYVQFKKNATYKEKKLKCFEGEIVPITNERNGNKIDITINKAIVRDLTIPSEELTEFPANLSYLENKAALVEKTDDYIYINGVNISASDSAKLLSKSGEFILKISGGKVDSIKEGEFGDSVRLIISKSPSIYYAVSDLKPYDRKSIVVTTDPKNDESDKDKNRNGNKFSWWCYLLIALVLVGGAFIGRRFLPSKELEPDELIFGTMPLRVMVEKYGGFDLLSKLNPGVFPQNWATLSEDEYDELKKRFNGRTIKTKDDGNTGNSPGSTTTSNLFQDEDKLKPKLGNQTLDESANGNAAIILSHLGNAEKNIISKINELSGKIPVNNSGQLSDEITKLKGQEQILNKEIENLTTKNNELTTRLSVAENSGKNLEVNKISEQVIEVDFLRAYCESILPYLNLCSKVSEEAYDYFNSINQHNPQSALVPGNLLIKFQDSIRTIPVGNWTQILQDITDSGLTNNKQIRMAFAQIKSDEEKMKKEFRSLLFENVLIKYSSSILVLAEGFRNISRFQISPELPHDIQNTFSRHVSDLVNKVKATGLENKYVELFTHYGSYLGKVELATAEKSIPYKGISGLGKDFIVEIVSYGVTTESEDTKTLIILS